MACKLRQLGPSAPPSRAPPDPHGAPPLNLRAPGPAAPGPCAGRVAPHCDGGAAVGRGAALGGGVGRVVRRRDGGCGTGAGAGAAAAAPLAAAVLSASLFSLPAVAIAVSRNFLLTLSALNFFAPAASRADDAVDEGEASREGVAEVGAASDEDGPPVALAAAAAVPVRLEEDAGVGVGDRIAGGGTAVDSDAGVLSVATGAAVSSDTAAGGAGDEGGAATSLVSAGFGTVSAAVAAGDGSAAGTEAGALTASTLSVAADSPTTASLAATRTEAAGPGEGSAGAADVGAAGEEACPEDVCSKAAAGASSVVGTDADVTVGGVEGGGVDIRHPERGWRAGSWRAVCEGGVRGPSGGGPSHAV